MFQPVETGVSFPKLEEEILRFWRDEKIYEKSLERRQGAERFVFYEGPPTANGMPHPGHCLTRAIKDLFPRYQTMRGKLCERKAGWDTHGLPVEVEVCKELGIHSKEEIENYGIEPFIHKCQQSVWRYMQEWRRMTERIGFWVNLDEAYVTYHQSYVESVWWSLKQLFDRGLLYQGHKIVWWWAQGGTALSSGEVGQGYREVADPSVYVKFPLVSDERTKELGLDGASLLVWTTTPWTLPSNQFAAVNPAIEYDVIIDPTDETARLIVASELSMGVGMKPFKGTKTDTGAYAIVVKKKLRGEQLVGLRYKPPFDYFYKESGNTKAERRFVDLAVKRLVSRDEYLAWRVIKANFVSTDSGTGIVHIAPAFGEEDYRLLEYEQLPFVQAQFDPAKKGHHVLDEQLSYTYAQYDPREYIAPKLLNPVLPNGTFSEEVREYRGRWVKDCDKDIIRDLNQRGLLFHREEYRHEYPFCWRAEEDPLIQYPRRSWFIRTSDNKEKMLENNRHINWLPEHIKEGRFGNFLETNVDWALSRERFWGTPLPIWVCEKTGKMEAVGSYDELLKKPGIQGTEVWDAAKKANPDLPDDLKVHKPYIDALTYNSPFADGARMKRVSEVIDGWYDSGAMPFAQWGYLGETTHKAAIGNRGEAPTDDPLADRAGAVEKFHEQFPADFISEALDQTRGWFYSQLAISTLLFSPHENAPQAQGLQPLGFMHPYPHPFKNCIVLGLMLGEDGQKMSKQKRNYREPAEIFDKYGADALRWYFFATQPPWTIIRYSERAIRDSIPEFLLRLWNVYSFFVIYANIDGFDPAAEVSGRWSVVSGQKSKPNGPSACGLASALETLEPAALATAETYRPIQQRSELDRWILSELNRAAKHVVEKMDAYDNYAATQRIIEFVDALSNWYVRRSRDRFWSEDKHDPDKLDAYWTLYECLLTTAKIIAPFVPFLAEAMWRNLAGSLRQAAGSSPPPTAYRLPPASIVPSVHLTDFPTGDDDAIDEQLSTQMYLVREIASLGLAARMGAKLKVRQPLAKVEVILADRSQQAWLESHVDLLKKELNVKQVEFTQEADHYITYTVLPDLKRLGPRLGKKLPLVKNALAKADVAKLLAEMESAGSVSLKLDDGSSEPLGRDDLQVRLQAKPGWAAAQGKDCVVVLATDLSPELITEGVARELVHAIQSRRKDTSCEYTDRIEVGVESDAAEIRRAVEQFGDYIRGETLATQLNLSAIDDVQPEEIKLGDDTLRLYVKVTAK